MKYIFKFCQGRHTFFALFFAICGTILAFHGKLTPAYVALMTGMQALILGHSIKEGIEAAQKANG